MFEDLKTFLVEELRVNADDVTMEAELAADLGINSLELADLVYLCEERFNDVIFINKKVPLQHLFIVYLLECLFLYISSSARLMVSTNDSPGLLNAPPIARRQ